MLDGLVSCFHAYDGSHADHIRPNLTTLGPVEVVWQQLFDQSTALFGVRPLIRPYRHAIAWNPADEGARHSASVPTVQRTGPSTRPSPWRTIPPCRPAHRSPHQQTLNPRVRGSSPWRRTRDQGSDLAVLARIRAAFMSTVDGCVLRVCSGANGRVGPLADWMDWAAPH